MVRTAWNGHGKSNGLFPCCITLSFEDPCLWDNAAALPCCLLCRQYSSTQPCQHSITQYHLSAQVGAQFWATNQWTIKLSGEMKQCMLKIWADIFIYCDRIHCPNCTSLSRHKLTQTKPISKATVSRVHRLIALSQIPWSLLWNV